MRSLMASAAVGDDVYGEDPTVQRLESDVSALLGKEAAVFMPTGTMANLACILAHTRRGDQVIVGQQSHIYCWEQGGASSIASCLLAPVRNEPDGSISISELSSAIQADDPHLPRSRLVCLENTHGGCLGTAVPCNHIHEVSDICSDHGLALHIDGARLLNAAVALGERPAMLVDAADSVSICLSKGLGCPAGSVVAGESAFISQVRRERKLLGGGMRQSGVLAAAGLYALEGWGETLGRDHERAARLADFLETLAGVEVQRPAIATNMVVFGLASAPGEDASARTAGFCAALEKAGLLIFPYGGRGTQIRAVLHQVLCCGLPAPARCQFFALRFVTACH